MTFGERLNETRKFRCLTAQNMADMLEMGIRSYRFYESNRSQPPYDKLVKIADILDVPLDWLLSSIKLLTLINFQPFRSKVLASDTFSTSVRSTISA